jgi:hypothetical protein
MTQSPHITNLLPPLDPWVDEVVDRIWRYGKPDPGMALACPTQQSKTPAPRAARKLRKPRRPSISKMIAQAEKAGKPVTSITTPDGMTLRFGEPEPGALENPWFADLDKAKQQ